jgi:hypothetical protein
MTEAEIISELNAIPRLKPPKPRLRPAKLVCVGGRIVGDADVIVSPSDPNWWRGMAVRKDGLVEVRR